MPYELREKKDLRKWLGILSFLGTGAMTGSPQAAAAVKEKAEKVLGFFDSENDRNTISGIVENIVGEAWEEACDGYGLSSECRQELAQYNIMSSIDDWDSLATIRCNIIRICKKNNVRLNTIDPGDISRKLLKGIVSRVENDPVLTQRAALRELLSDTAEIKQKLDEIMDAINAGKGNDPELFGRLMERFLIQSSENPSIKMMTPDPSLYPRGLPVITSSERTAKTGSNDPYPIKDLILESWKKTDRKHILLVGEGGIGKTVAMLTLPAEEWLHPYRIPAIYVPLQVLKNYNGRLNDYIETNYRNDLPGITELANSKWTERPNLFLLLDGFNEIPDKDKIAAMNSIEEWMGKPGVQVITTSRISLSLDAQFQEYKLQPLPKEVIRNYLLSSGITEEKLPGGNDPVWTVINVPLMLTIYTQTGRVRKNIRKYQGIEYLAWKESDNAAHIIWNYIQVELCKLIKNDRESAVLSAAALFGTVPYICCRMARSLQFRIKQDEMIGLVKEALRSYEGCESSLPKPFRDIRTLFGRHRGEKPFQEDKWEDHLCILTEKTALFQEIFDRDEDDNIEIYCVPAHQNFRDALAAIYVSACMLNMSSAGSSSSSIERILGYADHFVKKYMVEFLSDEEIIRVWDSHRKNSPENGRITWILLDIIGRKRNYDYSEIDFSGLDLTGTNLYRLLSRRPDIRPLPAKADYFNGTKLSFESFLPEGHTAAVTSIAYSSNGRHVASGSEDGTVRIWDLESGESRSLEGHRSFVTSVAYSPDGRSVASGSYDGTVRIWDPESGESRPLEDPGSWVRSVAYSPDGRSVARGSSDGTVRIWDLESGESRPLERHGDWVTSVAYSPDGGSLASGSYDGTVRIWDLESGESRSLEGYRSGVMSVAYSPDGRSLAGGSVDNTVQIWDLKSGESRSLEGHRSGVTSVAYSPDGRSLVSGSYDGTVRIWDLEKGTGLPFRTFCHIYHLNLHHVNFHLAEMSTEDREKLKECGAIV